MTQVVVKTLAVLVVEDEGRLRDMLVRAVNDMGFDAAGVASAEAALRWAAERPLDIVLLDLNLPGMHGMDLFARLRQQQPAAQVIVLTGFGDLESAQRAVHMDAVDFLTKPCALGDLEIALDRARARRSRQFAEPASAPPPPRPRRPEPAESNALEAVERRHILTVREKNNGNRAATAAELGISLRKLYYRLGQYQREGLLP